LDADLRADLARPATHDVLVLPIMMRGRSVAILYGDDGDHRVEYAEIGEVVAMASLLASALERVLLRKKRAALRDSSAVKSKRGPAIDRSSISPSDHKGVAPDASAVAAKRGVWSEEEIVDEGWSVPEGEDGPVRTTPQGAKKS